MKLTVVHFTLCWQQDDNDTRSHCNYNERVEALRITLHTDCRPAGPDVAMEG